MKKLELNQDNLRKACDILGIPPAEIGILEKQNPFLLKATATPVEVDPETEELQQSLLKKGLGIDLKKGMQIDEKAKDVLLKSLGIDPTDLKKAAELSTNLARFNDLVKGLGEEQSKNFQALQKQLSDSVSGLKIDEIRKGLESFNSSIEGIDKRLKVVENTGMGKKSITKDFIQKGFAKPAAIPGQGGSDEGSGRDLKEGEVEYSLSQDVGLIKGLLSERLDKALAGGKGGGIFMKAAQQYDANKTLPRPAILALENEGIFFNP